MAFASRRRLGKGGNTEPNGNNNSDHAAASDERRKMSPITRRALRVINNRVLPHGAGGIFSHMFSGGGRGGSAADLRRRALTLIDVVVERHGNGPLVGRRVAIAIVFSVAYFRYWMPMVSSWGNRRWHAASRLGVVEAWPGGPNADVHWAFAFVVTVGYLSFIIAGTHAMERREPVQKRIFEYMIVYNFTQALLNLNLFIRLLLEAWNLGFQHPWGNTLDYSEKGYALGFLIWCQYHCRQLELLDTVFMILRKKFRGISFLHVYLRLLNMWGWFFACRFACGGDTYFPAAVNSGCQVLVYLYFGISMISAKGVPLIRKARVTEVQMTQFIVCAMHAVYVAIRGNLPRALAGLNILVMGTCLFLFTEFHFEEYQQPKQQLQEQEHEQRQKSQGKDSRQNSRLTFSFDSSGWLYVYHFGVALWLQEHMFPKDTSPEACASASFCPGIAFSGSSGGSLVAASLATGIDIKKITEYVLDQYHLCKYNPWRMLSRVDEALKVFLPANGYMSMTGRVRVLLTRVSSRPPFLLGEVVHTFADNEFVCGALRASCHVPLLSPLPYRLNGRYYYDGLAWSSIFVPWHAADDDHAVKVSAIGAPLSNIRAGLLPLWWTILPPPIRILRGLFWKGYRDADEWFRIPPRLESCESCRCRRPDPADKRPMTPEMERWHLARGLLERPPDFNMQPKKVIDDITGEDIEVLLAEFRNAATVRVTAMIKVGTFGILALCAIAIFGIL